MRESVRYDGRANAREFQARSKKLVLSVMENYVRVKGLPLLCAINPDPDPVSVSSKWSPTTCHYGIDVEEATRQALKDDLSLQAAWFKLALGEIVPAGLAQRVFDKCSRFYRARGLEPGHYFGSSSTRR